MKILKNAIKSFANHLSIPKHSKINKKKQKSNESKEFK
jgi:hypothetical protein